jgi:hypothetical protein
MMHEIAARPVVVPWQLALAAGLAELTLAIGDYDETERLYRRVADEQPTNLQVRRMLFELAVRGNSSSYTEFLLAV